MTKKSFIAANPAIAFISSAKGNTVAMKRHPELIETKSKRVQMLMQPSLYASIKAQATQKGLSVNEMMHVILQNHVDH